MGGFHYWPDRQDPVPPEAFVPPDPVPEILDQVATKGPLAGGIVWPPETPKRGDAHDFLDSTEQQRGSGTHVTGPAVDPTATAGPPDLDHAIQAATEALWQRSDETADLQGWNLIARIAAEAAAPVLLQAMRDRLVGYRTADGRLWYPDDVEVVYEAVLPDGR